MRPNHTTVGLDDIVASLAVTLDGYVARKDGEVDYLEKYPITEFDFDAFVEGVGAIIMGRASYVQAVEWGWQWSAYPTMVLTSRTDLDVPEGADVRFSSAPTAEAIAAFAAATPKRLWVFGGGRVITDGLLGNAIDTLDLMVIPEAIGSGIPLFAAGYSAPMHVSETTGYSNGALRIVYNL
jgi:dihydrofolate reductase